MKTIVTHYAPDLDAVTSVWLIKRFLHGWRDANVKFVPAGKTLDDDVVDIDPDILHVDTGLGKLDHHQTDEDTCAARRTMEYIKEQITCLAGRRANNRKQELKKNKVRFPDEALERLVEVVNNIDHFREVYYPLPAADHYDFGLVAILDGLKLIYPEDPERLVSFSLIALDGIYKSFQNKVWAEKEIKNNGVIFKTKWGKCIGFETVNDEVVRLSQKIGYILAVRKDPKKGYIRIKAQPESKIDLSLCYNIFKGKDREATWYLHPGKKMILNGSMKNPDCRPTKLSLKEIIEVLKK